MRLKYLLAGILEVHTTQDREIYGLSQDTRTLKPGDLFVAYPGHLTDGRQYMRMAFEKGAAAIITIKDENNFSYCQGLSEIPILCLDNLNARLGDIAARFYQHPTQNMLIMGVTGTNGKTTCTHFIAACLAADGQTCGVIGSLSNGYYDQTGYHELQHNRYHLTTPAIFELYNLLSIFREKSIYKVVIEVSSHALDQNRLGGITFYIAAFTNLSHDHLDYHITLEHYAKAKRRLFESPQLKYAIFNIDDDYGMKWRNIFSKQKAVYSYTVKSKNYATHIKNLCSVKLLTNLSTGIHIDLNTPWGQGRLQNSSLIGQYMLSNLLLVINVLGILNIPFTNSVRYLSNLKPVKGRMETLGGGPLQPLVVIDYAHTPEALEKILETLQPIAKNLWCVFGCGGNRDRKKRPLMGKIAERYANKVILTQDNPRLEDSQQIMQDILSGFADPKQITIHQNRWEAIYYAVRHAQAKDIVLIAGKGHENYQIIGETELPFSDYEAAQTILNMK